MQILLTWIRLEEPGVNSQGMLPKTGRMGRPVTMRGIAALAATLAAALLWVPSTTLAQGVDSDLDGIDDVSDNCVATPNFDQHDDDQDLYGDVCDPDLNNDGIADLEDIAEFIYLMGTGDLEPDLSGDGRVDYRDLGLLNSMLGSAPGPRGTTAADIDPPYLLADPNVMPAVEWIEGRNQGPARPVVRLLEVAGVGGYFDFVGNEVLLISDDPHDAVDLAARWNGAVLASVDPSVELGIPGPTMYVVQVDPTGVDLSQITPNLAALTPQNHGEYRVSDLGTAELIGLVLEERVNHGLDVSLNVLLASNAFAERTTREASATMVGVAPPSGRPYTRNAFEWTTHEIDPDIPGDGIHPHDTRVAEAWRILEASGRIGNRSRAMIADGGFRPNEDFPPFTAVGPMRVSNPDPTNCGGSTLFPSCQWHGTHVVEAGWGLPDNDFGTAGPGGPVSDLTLLQSPTIDVGEIVGFILGSIPTALATRPDVLNISAGFDIPAGFCILACPPLDFMTRTLTRSGVLVVASAGNASLNVDREDSICFIWCIRFEASASVPCELDDVLCVGAMLYQSSDHASYSNFGTNSDANSVDIWAPGNVWSVNALAADSIAASPNDDLQIIRGTSFASPFVAGVATLVNSAQPALNARQIRDCLVNTAHPAGASVRADARVDAVAAVGCATGGRTHPFLEITGPSDGSSYEEGAAVVYIGANADDAEDGSALTIHWSSNIDGPLTTTTPGVGGSLGSRTLSPGTHTLTARVTDSTGLSVTRSVEVTITNPRPILNLILPHGGDSYYDGQTISLLGSSYDLNGSPSPGPLADSDVYWTRDGAYLGTNHARVVEASSLAIGSRTFCFHGIDDEGEAGVPDCITIEKVPVPVNAHPVVVISSPARTNDFWYPSGPVELNLEWTAIDDEDGTIPWSQTRVLVSTNGGDFVDRTADVTVVTFCAWPLAPPLICGRFETDFLLEVEGTDATTNLLIRIEATDSTPAPDTGVGHDEVYVTIHRLI